MTIAHPIPDTALALHTAFVGMTGSGKTSTAKLAVEQVVGQGARVCILDPIKSDWWGITSSADGKRPGLPFMILGGPHGHLPLADTAGEVVAALVADGRLPLSILDMAEFGPGGLPRFFAAFAAALLRLNAGSVYLVIEEAHLFAPKERGGQGPETHAIHYAKLLATAGRSKGIRLIVATQRVQSLHNALLGSCDTLVAHRLTTPADQAPVRKWLSGNVSATARRREIEDSLAALPTGTGWLCSGAAGLLERVAFPRIATFDNTATPEIGSGPRQAVKQAEVDVAAIRKALASSDQASKPAAHSKTTRKTLESEAGASAGDPAAAERRGYERGLAEGRAAEWRRGESAIRAEVAVLAQDAQALANRARALNQAIAAISREAEAGAAPSIKVVPEEKAARMAALADARSREAEARKPSERQAKPARPAAASSDIGAERKPLAVLASVHPAGMTDAQWAVAAGFKRTGGTWTTYRSRLRTAGRIEQASDGRWFATEDGLFALGDEPLPVPPPGPELVEFWASRIPGAGPMLRYLARIHPRAVSREALAAELGLAATGGTFGTYLSRLRTADLVVNEGRDGVRAAPILFPERQP